MKRFILLGSFFLFVVTAIPGESGVGYFELLAGSDRIGTRVKVTAGATEWFVLSLWDTVVPGGVSPLGGMGGNGSWYVKPGPYRPPEELSFSFSSRHLSVGALRFSGFYYRLLHPLNITARSTVLWEYSRIAPDTSRDPMVSKGGAVRVGPLSLWSAETEDWLSAGILLNLLDVLRFSASWEDGGEDDADESAWLYEIPPETTMHRLRGGISMWKGFSGKTRRSTVLAEAWGTVPRTAPAGTLVLFGFRSDGKMFDFSLSGTSSSDAFQDIQGERRDERRSVSGRMDVDVPIRREGRLETSIELENFMEWEERSLGGESGCEIPISMARLGIVTPEIRLSWSDRVERVDVGGTAVATGDRIRFSGTAHHRDGFWSSLSLEGRVGSGSNRSGSTWRITAGTELDFTGAWLVGYLEGAITLGQRWRITGAWRSIEPAKAPSPLPYLRDDDGGDYRFRISVRREIEAITGVESSERR